MTELEELTERLEELISDEPLLQLFRFAHLPARLVGISSSFAELACFLVEDLPRNPERSTALRKLREAKDCSVTARLWV